VFVRSKTRKSESERIMIFYAETFGILERYFVSFQVIALAFFCEMQYVSMDTVSKESFCLLLVSYSGKSS